MWNLGEIQLYIRKCCCHVPCSPCHNCQKQYRSRGSRNTFTSQARRDNCPSVCLDMIEKVILPYGSVDYDTRTLTFHLWKSLFCPLIHPLPHLRHWSPAEESYSPSPDCCCCLAQSQSVSEQRHCDYLLV